MKFWVFVLRRIILLIPILIGVVTITFVIVQAIPTTDRLEACYPPSRHFAYPQPGTPQYAALEKLCGISGPIWDQYVTYLDHTFTFQWGYVSPDSSLHASVPAIGACYLVTASSSGASPSAPGVCAVTTLMENWFGYTIELAALAMLLTLLLAIPMGNRSAVLRDRPFDQGTRILSFIGFATPGFLAGVGFLLILYFVLASIDPSGGCYQSPYNMLLGSWPGSGPQGVVGTCYPAAWSTAGGPRPPFANALWGTSPTGIPTIDAIIYASTHSAPAGYPSDYLWGLVADHLLRLVIPAITVALGTIAYILRFVRNSMLEVINQDFVRTARSKGVPEKLVMKKHVGRNSLNVTTTVIALTFAGFLSGFVIIESLFGLYGVGSLFAYALLPPPDVGTIFASTILFTFVIVAVNLFVDILYGWLDPRVRLYG